MSPQEADMQGETIFTLLYVSPGLRHWLSPAQAAKFSGKPLLPSQLTVLTCLVIHEARVAESPHGVIIPDLEPLPVLCFGSKQKHSAVRQGCSP